MSCHPTEKALECWQRWPVQAHTGTQGMVAMAKGLQFPKELFWETFWDLEMNLSERATCGERLLTRHTETGIFGK